VTVAELIAALQNMPQDAPVLVANECADYGRTYNEASDPKQDRRRVWQQGNVWVVKDVVVLE
jgi:hypothetical protein